MGRVLSARIAEAQADPCALCGGQRTTLLYDLPDLRVFGCGTCDVTYVRPRSTPHDSPEHANDQSAELGRRYMQEVFIDRTEFWLSYWRKHVGQLRPFIESPTPRLLDIGCAMGHFMLAAKEAGWVTRGVEISVEQASYAREVLNLDVRAGAFEDAPYEPHSFDVITLWGVIEHIADPIGVMRKLADLLRPGGLVALRTPNRGSLITRVAALTYLASGGRAMLPVYSDDHIFRFNEDSLRYVFRATGFDALQIRQDDDLAVMLARMQLERFGWPRAVVLAGVHALARTLRMENQLLAYGRVR
jgi:2-polyprenyl-3-methyl-5-hydroxy-6-metoxy-1,4-benzoquinol methylase